MSIWNRAGKIAASLALVGAGLVLGATLTGTPAAVGHETQQAAPAVRTDAADLPAMVPQGDFVRVADQLRPAVVFIEASRPQQRASNGRLDQFFEDFFGRRNEEDVPEEDTPEDLARSQGSGVLVSPDGYILTNAHVVASFNPQTQGTDMASEVMVTLFDEGYYEAEIVGADLGTDIALLKIGGSALPYAPLGDSDRVQVGEWVMAVGAPFGLQNTVSAGIVSALGRADLAGMTTNYQDFVQTDAAINPGNSGGPLVNLAGEVIGINTAIATNGGLQPAFSGVGFAVPANHARRVMDQLRANGRVIRGYLGVTVRQLDRDMRDAFDIDPRARGAVINDVNADGPADDAGVQIGDIVVGLDGERLASQQDFLQRIARHMPGDTVELEIFRGGEELEIAVTLTERPDEAEILASQLGLNNAPPGRSDAREEPEDIESNAASQLGLRVMELTRRLAERAQLDADIEGVMISAVAPNSPAARAGLEQGDVIMRVGQTAVSSVDEFDELMADYGPGDAVALYVHTRRANNSRYIPLRIPRD